MSADEAPLVQPVQWPADGRLTPEWVVALGAALESASHAPPAELPRALPVAVWDKLITAATELLSAEETLVEVVPPAGCKVTVVGDTHGQLHDVLRLFSADVAGVPSSDSLFILNGDFVDRRAPRDTPPRARRQNPHWSFRLRTHSRAAAHALPQRRVGRGGAGARAGVEGGAAAIRVHAARQPREQIRNASVRLRARTAGQVRRGTC